MLLSASCNRVECSVVEFYKACVETKGYARVSDCAMSCIMESLRDRGAIDRFSGQWTDMPVYEDEANEDETDDETDEDETDGWRENKHFKNMETIFERVLAAAAEACPTRFALCDQTADFSCLSDCQTAPDVPGAPFHVDALSYLRNPTYTREAEADSAHNCKASAPGLAASVYTADVAVTWEFKLWDDEASVRRVCSCIPLPQAKS